MTYSIKVVNRAPSAVTIKERSGSTGLIIRLDAARRELRRRTPPVRTGPADTCLSSGSSATARRPRRRVRDEDVQQRRCVTYGSSWRSPDRSSTSVVSNTVTVSPQHAAGRGDSSRRRRASVAGVGVSMTSQSTDAETATALARVRVDLPERFAGHRHRRQPRQREVRRELSAAGQVFTSATYQLALTVTERVRVDQQHDSADRRRGHQRRPTSGGPAAGAQAAVDTSTSRGTPTPVRICSRSSSPATGSCAATTRRRTSPARPPASTGCPPASSEPTTLALIRARDTYTPDLGPLDLGDRGGPRGAPTIAGPRHGEASPCSR